MTRPRLSRWLLGASIALWGTSLVLPAIKIPDEPVAPGWSLLAVGWLGVPMGVTANLAWLANPMLLVGWIAAFCLLRRPSLIVAMVVLALAVLPFLSPAVAWNEGGMPGPITQFGAGYWAWLASGAMLAAAAVAL